MKADRFNEGKLKWSLVDFKSLEPLVKILEYGAEKYAPDNWKKGLDKKEIIESMLRHIFDYLDGNINDKESGLPHIGHIMANAMFLSYFENHFVHPIQMKGMIDPAIKLNTLDNTTTTTTFSGI